MALKGTALLEYLAANAGKNRDEIIEGAGYSVTRNGKLSLQKQKFYDAMAQAHGHEMVAEIKERPEGFGKEAAYRLKVGPKGLIPVSRAYTDKCGMEPGSYVSVVIEDGAIVLEPEKVESSTPPAATLATVA